MQIENAFYVVRTINQIHLIFHILRSKVEHILTFLEEFAKNIVVQGVHMVFNAQVILWSSN